MAVKTFTVNLEGNLEDAARKGAAAVNGLVESMTSLEGITLGLAAASVGLGVALLGATGYAIEASERVDRLSASFGALSGQGPEAGRKILESVRAVAAELPESERVIQSWAQQLMAVGVTDLGQLRAQMYAISGAEALVEGGGERVRSTLLRLNEASERGTKLRFNIAQLAGTGLTEQDLLKHLGMSPQQLEAAKKQATLTGQQIAVAITDAINEKAHGPLARAMTDITTRLKKGADVVSHLFEGISFDKIGEQVTTFFSIFDQATPSGQALKDGIGGAVQWVGDKLAWLTRQTTLFVLDTIILVLKAELAWKEATDKIGDYLDTHQDKIRMWEAIIVGAVAGVSIAILASLIPSIVASTVAFVASLPALAAYAVMMGALALETIIAAAPFILLALGIGLVVAALIYFWPQIKKAIAVVEEWAQKGWDAAVNFVAGMVGGIVNGVESVVNAVKNLGKSAWDALTSFWKVHSPSQLAFGLGANIAEGQAQGIESKDGRVQTAATDTMAKLPSRGGSGNASSSAGASVTWSGDIHVIAHDGQQAREVVDELEERMPSILERWALSQGVAPG